MEFIKSLSAEGNRGSWSSHLNSSHFVQGRHLANMVWMVISKQEEAIQGSSLEARVSSHSQHSARKAAQWGHSELPLSQLILCRSQIKPPRTQDSWAKGPKRIITM